MDRTPPNSGGSDAVRPARRAPEAAVPLESETDPGIPRFMWAIYAAMIAFAFIYLPLNFSQPATPAGQPAVAATPLSGAPSIQAGEQVFKKNPCGSCHAVTGTASTVGPNLAHIGGDAEKIVKDPGYKGKAKTADEFLRESIVEPGAYIAPGFQDGVMPKTFGQTISQTDLDSLVVYLMSLK